MPRAELHSRQRESVWIGSALQKIRACLPRPPRTPAPRIPPRTRMPTEKPSETTWFKCEESNVYRKGLQPWQWVSLMEKLNRLLFIKYLQPSDNPSVTCSHDKCVMLFPNHVWDRKQNFTNSDFNVNWSSSSRPDSTWEERNKNKTYACNCLSK